MPLYEYRCSTCGSLFEVLRRLGQGPEGLCCPQCGRPDVEKEYSTFASATSGGGSAAGAGCSPSSRFT